MGAGIHQRTHFWICLETGRYQVRPSPVQVDNAASELVAPGELCGEPLQRVRTTACRAAKEPTSAATSDLDPPVGQRILDDGHVDTARTEQPAQGRRALDP